MLQEMKTVELKHVPPECNKRKSSFAIALEAKFKSNRDNSSLSGEEITESDVEWDQ